MTYAPPSPRLEVPAGYTPMIGAIVAMLDNSRASTLAAADGLSIAELERQVDEKANPIGALLAHSAAVEWFYCVASAEGRQPEPHEWGEWGALLRLTPGTWAAVRGQTLDQHAERLARVRAMTHAALAGRTDAWLAEPLKLVWMPEPTNHLWAWYHVLEDELNHRGQIRWLRQRL